jgi:uncharacterized OsmC-like protein
MASKEIAAAWERLERIVARRPPTLRDDRAASARWDAGLRVVVDGAAEIVTDMPPELGGGGSGPTPGWLARAGLASCLVSCIAVLAAREGVALSSLEAEASSRSDLTGLFPGLREASDPGPHDIEIRVRIAATGVSDERLRQLVEKGHQMSPVSALFQAARPIALQISVQS